MKKLTIENKEFNLKDIKQLYPAVIIKTGYKDETTEMSLEWIDTEAKGKVEVVGYGLFVSIDDEKYSFMYKTRDELNHAIGLITQQINS
ncbi:MAG: phosphomannomutase [Epsilonproteobacteria bacterium]|nr:phosphomannomutase [Campylobacterota bacterium]